MTVAANDISRSRRAKSVGLPSTRLLDDALARVDWSDAYAVRRAPDTPSDPQVWADAIFHAPPAWTGALLRARELLVGLVGIERAGPGTFDTVERSQEEVLLGIDQPHLSFRASVLCEADQVVVSTVVQLHNRRGRLYSAIVRRVHPTVVRAMLTRAAAGQGTARGDRPPDRTSR